MKAYPLAFFGALWWGLLVLQLALLAVSLFLISRRKISLLSPPGLLLVASANVLAVANILRLGQDLRWAGLGAELVQVLWFAAPLSLIAVAIWPQLSRNVSEWWASPVRLILSTFPLVFVIAGLGRIDFQQYTGAPTPNFIRWLLAYVPTLAVVYLALHGWLACEARGKSSSPSPASVAAVLLSVLLITVLASGIPFGPGGPPITLGFIFSATITWGSGYQLFRTPVPSPLSSLALPLALVTAAFSALLVTVYRLRRNHRPVVVPLLAWAAVLSGIFEDGTSILGSLVALELLWLNLHGDSFST
ncbi:MAG: hypothetical protein GTO63_13625 [Anaerolineae bacterium]|nr:hypothetical protein [Anaerolineae bacterium]